MGCQDPWVASKVNGHLLTNMRFIYRCTFCLASVWTWTRFWAALPFSFEAIRASVVASKNKDDGVRNTFITTWGDEGNECDVYSILFR